MYFLCQDTLLCSVRLRMCTKRRAVCRNDRRLLEGQPKLSWSVPQIRFHASPCPLSLIRRMVLRSDCERSCPSEKIDSVSCSNFKLLPPPSRCSLYTCIHYVICTCTHALKLSLALSPSRSLSHKIYIRVLEHAHVERLMHQQHSLMHQQHIL